MVKDVFVDLTDRLSLSNEAEQIDGKPLFLGKRRI